MGCVWCELLMWITGCLVSAVLQRSWLLCGVYVRRGGAAGVLLCLPTRMGLSACVGLFVHGVVTYPPNYK
ncbi:hypothetical protein COO60DRAFT_1574706 [Scenedesmus sp. NREL 46B-D3]|nr:hypothetical protein COO60DRAFT_1574706 [Scenedesmus sp. NREL 46B-D3]